MAAPFRIPASAARQRGLPLGIEVTPPADVEVQPVTTANVVLRCREQLPDGQPLGELEVGVFAAALIIDRDGILENKVRDAGEVSTPTPMSLPGGSGYRAELDVARDAVLRYGYAIALASHDLGIDGGLLVIVRSARPEWPAADAILRSLRILTRTGVAKVANDFDAS